MSFVVHGFVIHVETVCEEQIREMGCNGFLDAALEIVAYRQGTKRDLMEEWVAELEYDWYDNPRSAVRQERCKSCPYAAYPEAFETRDSDYEYCLYNCP